VGSGIKFSSDKLSSSSQLAVSAFASGSSLLVGIWDKKNLIEVRSLDLNNMDKVETSLKGLLVNEINLVHDSDVFVHADTDTQNATEIENLFTSDLLRRNKEGDKRISEKLKRQSVFTHSFVSKQNKLAAENIHTRTKVNHISTAMGNYSLNAKDNILVLIGEKKMSLMIHKKGFKEFVQYDLENARDYLYYILLAAQNHNLDITAVPVLIGGNIDISSPLYQTLKAHIYNLQFCKADKFACANTKHPIHYYLPLLIARACA